MWKRLLAIERLTFATLGLGACCALVCTLASPRTSIADTPVATGHWSFQPLVRHELPHNDGEFSQNFIDTLILAKLDEARLAPSGPADARTLIRRLNLMMLGIPPSPVEVAHFVESARPDAWERLVDRTLADPRYGERWAQHWIDITGWGESDGFEGNAPRENAWPYRDYIIQSFNDDKPYDVFVREQIAGDAFGNPTATGFLVAGPADRVKSPDIVLTLNQRQDELAHMIDTTGTVFLGLTLGCARCHDHMFDPITHRDYYAMQAVFAGVQHRGEADEYIGKFEQPGPTHRLDRGDPLQKQEVVAPGAISSLAGFAMDAESTEQRRRIRFAQWLTRADNASTWRVIVNRLWQHQFGIGLVDTPSDIGSNGSRPTHPKLLDALAIELVRSDGSLKHVHRQILLSNTFRQQHVPRKAALAIDAESRLLWRYPPHRLEAEAIRDSMLAVSGVLNNQIGGPGFLGFELQVPTDRVFLPKKAYGPGDWRRMIYMTKIRQESEPTFGVFDCPNATHTVGQRSRSTTPLQALNLANGTFVIQQAQLLAARIQREVPDSAELQVRRAFSLVLCRAPDVGDLKESIRIVELFGMATLCRALLNSNEFVFVL
jgi:hypothetical protein